MDFNELMQRAQRSRDGQLLIGFDQIRHWPTLILDELLKHKIILKAQPAQTLVCLGCEEACCNPVQTFPGSDRAFIVCDLRSDTSRVPIKLERLQQWQLSLGAVYGVLSAQSGLAISVLESLPIIWQRVFLLDEKRLKIDSDYLLELSAKLQPANQAPLCNSFVLLGDYWNITFNQKTVTVNNTKGIRYIEYLIRNKGKEVHVSELFYAINPKDTSLPNKLLSGMSEEQLAAEGFSLGVLDDSFELLDKDAIELLKLRIEQLDDQIEDTKEFGEFEKQEKLEAEKDQIIARRSADLGLGGKSRSSNSAVERVRKSVEKRIRTDIAKLQKTFPEFADHIQAIKTGTSCQYKPDQDVFWGVFPKN